MSERSVLGLLGKIFAIAVLVVVAIVIFRPHLMDRPKKNLMVLDCPIETENNEQREHWVCHGDEGCKCVTHAEYLVDSAEALGGARHCTSEEALRNDPQTHHWCIRENADAPLQCRCMPMDAWLRDVERVRHTLSKP